MLNEVSGDWSQGRGGKEFHCYVRRRRAFVAALSFLKLGKRQEAGDSEVGVVITGDPGVYGAVVQCH
jgi:hypothetical protein